MSPIAFGFFNRSSVSSKQRDSRYALLFSVPSSLDSRIQMVAMVQNENQMITGLHRVAIVL